MQFEIINPSDAYTMSAADLEVAAVACCFLGDGKYSLRGLGEACGTDVPIFLLGGHDEWFVARFGMDFEATADHCLNHRAGELADAFDSVDLMGGRRRSSMNDIAARARALAQAVRRKAADRPATEQKE